MAYYLSNQNVFQEIDVESEQFFKDFRSFLRNMEVDTPSETEPIKYYFEEADKMKLSKRTTMYIDCNHLLTKEEYMRLFEDLHNEYYRLEPVVCKAVAHFLNEVLPEYARGKTFYVSFLNLFQIESIRDMKSGRLGKLIALKGTVTKSSEIRPELIEGQFKCELCGAKTAPVIQQFAYTIPKGCMTLGCTNKTKFDLLKENSKYIDWQKLRVQELDSDLPQGSTPRSIDVVLRNEQVEKAQPGDRAILIGTLIAVPDVFSMIKPGEKFELSKLSGGIRTPNMANVEGISGLSSLGIRDLNYKMIFLANNVQINDKKMSNDNTQATSQKEDIDTILETMTETEKQEITRISKEPDLLNKLSSLIAPSVYGNREIKKGILLMLLGGVTKITAEEMKLRGDLNICVVGDPATAKSQFLKFVHKFIPRTVYTSGKGSTAAGLTASISRDPESGEFTIEAGALILADNGICCIDEFDKMDEKDVVAIHEAMEQQTITLSKAGVQASLNARCSILAAANPIFGRYDKSKSLKANIKLSPPLMSRFDLFFILTDECNDRIDTILAQHIIYIHKNHKKENLNLDNFLRNTESNNQSGGISQAALLRYMRFTRQITPKISEEAAQMLEKGYLRLRTNELQIHKNSYRVTVRQLESLIRISEAIAKIHFETIVTKTHVEMAFDLLAKSMVGIHQPDMNFVTEEDEEQNHENNKTEQENQKINDIQKDELLEKVNQKKKKLISLPFEEYQRISKILIKILFESERQTLSKSALISLFLSQDIARIQSQVHLIETEKLVGIILKQMVEKEKVLVMYENEQSVSDPIIGIHSQTISGI